MNDKLYVVLSLLWAASPDPGFEMFPGLVRSPDVDPAYRAEGNGDVPPEFQRGGSRQDDEVGPAESRLELFHDRLEEFEGGAEVVVDLPVPAWREEDPGSVTAALVVGGLEGGGALPGQPSPESHSLLLLPGRGHQASLHFSPVRQLAGPGRQGMLPGLLGRSVIIDTPAAGPHVSGRQLVPGVGKLLVKVFSVLGKTFDNLLVLPVRQQGQVCGEQPYWLLLCLVVSSDSPRHLSLSPATRGRSPLPVSARSLELDPLVVEEVGEVLVVPHRGAGGEGKLEAAGCGVVSLPSARPGVATQPRPGVLRSLGWRGPGPSRTGPVTFPGGVTAAYESHRLGVVHPHPSKHLPAVRRPVEAGNNDWSSPDIFHAAAGVGDT